MSTRPELKTVDVYNEDAILVSSIIKDLGRPLEILEAGCGLDWPLDLDGVDYRLTGIDLDKDALQSRIQKMGDLHEAIIGDLAAPATIPASRYDVIYNSFVLEHIPDAEGALINMLNGLKPGGLLVLRIPDRDSVYGWTARRMPFRLHIAYYRYFVRYPHAGKPGHSPFPTYYAPLISRAGIRDFCNRNGCTILEERGHTYYVRGTDVRVRITRAYAKALSAISLGALSWRHNNLTYVIRKGEAGSLGDDPVS
ncbi:class I SAM-dependent methyltransferase [Mycobacterium kansasii]|uniref:Ubiquinone biosynthesis O-methyltransferase n=1 Tax=Mycobacterium attenuatum TaxID=2341086 RepID=A0A498Q919_9MYCO|nr:class I SAM-dependent methyltransferase [Mycobacterium attenuatum]VBA42066.1 Ubiquinone biosynthesis O-methyltransferase [Mycobacterium attenuatum]VBA58122.1 Ubiquinone biosynthesis O-methyltransferase [Mycobacterium attenuatum]VBA61118.1 Ubiquinone biosynthesis O-methyltransferase [Mycobacterium attenuatum]